MGNTTMKFGSPVIFSRGDHELRIDEADEPLGQGASGKAWKVTKATKITTGFGGFQTEETVALNAVLKYQSPLDRVGLKRSLLESKLAISGERPGLFASSVVDEDFDSHCSYILMPFVPGKDLLHHFPQGQVPGQAQAQVQEQVNPRPNLLQTLRASVSTLQAIIRLHRKGIVHRDIKLDNIMFDSTTGTARVIDFGSVYNPRHPQTKDLEANGTPEYLDPEQFAVYKFGQSGSTTLPRPTPMARDDAYATGITLARMLTPPESLELIDQERNRSSEASRKSRLSGYMGSDLTRSSGDGSEEPSIESLKHIAPNIDCVLAGEAGLPDEHKEAIKGAIEALTCPDKSKRPENLEGVLAVFEKAEAAYIKQERGDHALAVFEFYKVVDAEVALVEARSPLFQKGYTGDGAYLCGLRRMREFLYGSYQNERAVSAADLESIQGQFYAAKQKFEAEINKREKGNKALIVGRLHSTLQEFKEKKDALEIKLKSQPSEETKHKIDILDILIDELNDFKTELAEDKVLGEEGLSRVVQGIVRVYNQQEGALGKARGSSGSNEMLGFIGDTILPILKKLLNSLLGGSKSNTEQMVVNNRNSMFRSFKAARESLGLKKDKKLGLVVKPDEGSLFEEASVTPIAPGRGPAVAG